MASVIPRFREERHTQAQAACPFSGSPAEEIPPPTRGVFK
jgi:hypothetical protein